MKWYKKQLEKLEVVKPKVARPDENTGAHKARRHFFVGKNRPTNKNFFNPVAARNVNRPKTDSK